MSLRILNVAYPFAAVSSDAVGGAEQILSRLDRALVAAGYESLVLACPGSQVSGQLLEAPPPRSFTPEDRRLLHQQYRQLLQQIVESHSIDLVHLHGIDCCEYLPPAWVPALVTLHLPPAWYPGHLFQNGDRALYLNCVSQHQRSQCPRSACIAGVIENGVDVEKFHPTKRPCDYVLALGRICPDKNFEMALDAARAADLPLLLAGHVFPYPDHIDYFRACILPRLDERRRFIGPVGGRRKRRLLAAARCLVVSSVVPETSSLVAMEALASGTPVVARAIGALPDVVDHQRTGYLVHDLAEMSEAMRASEHLDRGACRQAAEQRFRASRMCAEYLALYEQLVHKPSLPHAIPLVTGAPS